MFIILTYRAADEEVALYLQKADMPQKDQTSLIKVKDAHGRVGWW